MRKTLWVCVRVLSFFCLAASLAGCVRRAPMTQAVCTRPLLQDKVALVSVAPVLVRGERSDRFAGVVEAAVQTWLRGRKARTVDVAPYDLHVLGTVAADASGFITVVLKVVDGENTVVANGEGSAVYGSSASSGSRSDVQAAGLAARLAAENLCATREREYLYPTTAQPPQAIPLAPQASQPPPPPEYYYDEHYWYRGPLVYGGAVRVSPGRMHGGGTLSLSLPPPLPILIYRAIKGDGDRHDGRRHGRGVRHGDRHRAGRHRR